MKMWTRLGTLALAIVLLAGAVSATSFGSFSSETERQVEGLSATYTISVFNLGDEPLRIELETANVDRDTTVRFNSPGSNFDIFTLEPSEVTENPSDEKDWFLLRNGKYAEVKTIEVRAFMDEARTDDVSDFTVNVHASPETSLQGYDGDGTNPSQNVVQVRSYSYTMETSAARQPVEEPETRNATQEEPEEPGFGAGLVEDFSRGVDQFVGGSSATGDATQDPDVRVEESDTRDEEDNNNEMPAPGGEDNTEPENQTEKTGGKATGNFFSTVNPVTPVLLIGVILSTIYLFRVV